ncbi:MAG TPA: hypothetical protein VF319_12290 [Caldimonas sp.]
MFDARHPDAPIHSGDPSMYPASLVPTKIPPSLLAKVGETFAGALSTLQRSFAALGPLAPDQQPVLNTGLAEIGRLEHLGVQIQELARVLGGDAPAAPERVDLARAAREALAEWTQAARLKGVSLAGPREPVELEVNAAVLEQLLDLGLEYALHIGSSVEVGAGLQGLPALPLLTIQVQRPQAPAAGGGDEDFNELHWLLFVHLARAIGLVPQRIAVGPTVTLMLGFPGAGAPGASAATVSPAQLPHTATAAGRRVLLIEPQDIARVHAHRLMRDVGMWVDSVGSIDQARASLRNQAPDIVVTGIPVDDEKCRALLDEVRATQPRLRVIELVDDDNAFAFSVPDSDRPARVARHEMAHILVRAMSQELDAAWPG